MKLRKLIEEGESKIKAIDTIMGGTELPLIQMIREAREVITGVKI